MAGVLESRRFSTKTVVTTTVIVLVLAGAGLVGWYGWRQNTKDERIAASSADDTTAASKSNSATTAQPRYPAGWAVHEDRKAGLAYAYPKSWQLGELRETATAQGEKGWTRTVTPISPQNGDPGLTIDTYPPDASIKDVDTGPNYIKVMDITTADNTVFTLMGFIEDPARVTQPTQLYATNCWPRSCSPRLDNGRYLSIAVGSTNNDCAPKVSCPIEFNTEGENYAILVDILKSIKSL